MLEVKEKLDKKEREESKEIEEYKEKGETTALRVQEDQPVCKDLLDQRETRAIVDLKEITELPDPLDLLVFRV